MRVQSLTDEMDCCGAVAFVGFNGDGLFDNQNFEKDEDVDKFLSKNEAHQRDSLQMAIAIVLLNDAQKLRYENVFKKRGWKFTKGCFHPKHSTRIHLGWKDLQKGQGKDCEKVTKNKETGEIIIPNGYGDEWFEDDY